MQEFVDFHFRPEVLGQFRLPAIGYPLPAECVSRLARGEHAIPFDVMLYCLQQKSADCGDQWPGLEAPMRRLIHLLGPQDEYLPSIAEAATWRLEIGTVFLDQQVVTLERDGCLLAALRPDDDGGLVLASYRPLDADSLVLLIQLATRPHERHGVCMCPNNWEYALDSTVSSDNFYASEHSKPYLSFFKHGIRDDEADLVAGCHTATQLEVFSRLSSLLH